ncbi:MAG: hypothetical protein P4L50_29155 [Anaerolineaceae bacterium]|nr:hypothetical protein [Anaerolineaceae bacterium]
MGGLETQPRYGKKEEILDPHHFYAAYVFDQAEAHRQDILTLIEQAQRLGYPLRYWWLSDAMDLQGSPDRLIVCIHHPSTAEDAGCDLYDALKEKGVYWDELDSAVVEEYVDYGKPLDSPGDLSDPDGRRIFPDTKTDG